MFDFIELLLLGAVAGFTIFLGLPVALARVSERTRGFLNALAVGILLFLIVDVFSHAWDITSGTAADAVAGVASPYDAGLLLVLMLGGLALGLLGLVYYERRYVGRAVEGVPPAKMATMIALGIGLHNLSEGLAIGQSYVSNEIGLAVVLIVGFGAHNATEGFGIVAPITSAGSRPETKFVAKLLFIGGAPTFFGTILGSLGFSVFAYVTFLALAGGALVYVTMTMFNSGRRQWSSGLMMVGVFIGLCAGFLTDLIVSIGGA